MWFAWVILHCLLAVIPPGVCTCDHEHDTTPANSHEHDDAAAPDCPCLCELAPRDAVTTPRTVADATDGLTFPVADFLVEPRALFDLKPIAVRCGEPPPHGPHAALPLYLSTSRLRN